MMKGKAKLRQFSEADAVVVHQGKQMPVRVLEKDWVAADVVALEAHNRTGWEKGVIYNHIPVAKMIFRTNVFY